MNFFFFFGEHIHIIETQGTFKLIYSYGKLMEMFIPKKKYSSQLSCHKYYHFHIRYKKKLSSNNKLIKIVGINLDVKEK